MMKLLISVGREITTHTAAQRKESEREEASNNCMFFSLAISQFFVELFLLLIIFLLMEMTIVLYKLLHQSAIRYIKIAHDQHGKQSHHMMILKIGLYLVCVFEDT